MILVYFRPSTMASLFPPVNSSFKLPSGIKSLLIKGCYHASAPIHFCLSLRESPSIFISPSRSTFAAALKDFDDDWLNVHGGEGIVARDLSRIKVFYPPTPAHFALLLSTLHCPQRSDTPHANSKVVLDVPPSYIVLHEISTFFLDNTSENSYTASSYLSLVAEALATTFFLSTPATGAVGLVLFDSRLDQLMLPIVRSPSRDNLFDGDRTEESSSKTFSVGFLAAKYFDWMADFVITDKDTERYTMKLCGPKEEIDCCWYIRKEPNQSQSSRESRTFVFDDI